MSKRRKKRGLKINRRLLIFFSVTPIGCLLAILVGLLIAWYLFPTQFVDAEISDFSDDQAQEFVIMVAADFAEHQDLSRARKDLAELQVPNKAQYVSLVAERMIRINRGPVDEEIKEVVRLAEALGVSTISMVAYVSTPTSTPTETPLPTLTPTNTPVIPTPTPTPVVVEETSTDNPAEESTSPTDEPTPTETTPPEPVATNTPAPPTDTPTPEPTPTPEFDFYITKLRLLTKDENGGCLGMHSIFVTVVDANGSPLKGVELGTEWDAVTGVTTGHKGDDKPGLAVYDLYKNGYKVFVKNDPTAGKPVTSEMTELLSSNDWEIGIPRLMEAGYCPDEGTCRTLWNSGVFGEGNNSLCWGHYSWEVTFQRAW